MASSLSRASIGVLVLLLLPLTAQATNGYFAHGYSASQRALGGAGTANPSDALISTINPAGTAFVDERWDLNLSLFVPLREYTAGESQPGVLGLGVVGIEPGTVESQHNLFAIPGFAFVKRLDDDITTVGLAVYGNGGLNTVYKQDESTASFFRAGSSGSPISSLLGGLLGQAPTESRCRGVFGGGAPAAGNADLLGFCGNSNGTASVDLIQLFVAPNISVKVSDKTAFGVSPIFAAQRFEAKGLQAFGAFSNSPDRVSDQGFDFSYGGGFRLGVQTELLPGLYAGASWQSRIRMSRFKKYEGLFAEQGDFDIPSTWNLGLALKPTPNQRILLDYQRINFNDIASVGLPLDPNRFINDCALPRLTGSTAASPACLGADGGPGFGWQDISVVKVGYQYQQGDWKWRAGYSQTEQPIPSSEGLFNILAPGVVEKHYTVGTAWQANKKLGLDLSFMYAPPNPVKGKNPLSNVQLLSGGQAINAGTDDGDQDITLDMRQFELTMGVNYTY